MIVSGILSVFFAVLIFLMPGAGIVMMIYLLGIYAVMFGLLMVLLGFSMRKLSSKTGN
jgi:uncharacterized membrane protein HdeD (DUF308 family)